jgi:hypothetical protein
MADDRLFEHLQDMARALDEDGPPVTPAEAVRTRATAHPHAYQRLALVGVAAAMVILVGILAWSALDDEDASPVVTPGPTTSTTSTTAPVDFDWNALPDLGIAVQALDGPLQLYSLEGDLLDNAPTPVDALNGPRLVAYPGQVDAEQVSAAEVPEGCTSAEGGGGVRVALCGSADDLPDRIDLVDSAGQATMLRDGLPQAGTSEPALGHWRWATPSPDGRWVLAQWSGECEAPMAFVIEVATGEYRTVSGESGADWFNGRASFGLGWAPDGRAVVSLPESACGTSATEPGVYLLDPTSGQLDLAVASTAATEQSFLWTKGFYGNAIETLTSRALTDLGLEGCCGEPSHGGGGVTSGAVFEGYLIGIRGVPTGSAEDVVPTGSPQRMSLLHGEATIVSGAAGGSYGSTVVAFTCGANTWRLSWWDDGTVEVDSMLLLAEALVPLLACTLGEPPDG